MVGEDSTHEITFTLTFDTYPGWAAGAKWPFKARDEVLSKNDERKAEFGIVYTFIGVHALKVDHGAKSPEAKPQA
jgi:hypothetical protein